MVDIVIIFFYFKPSSVCHPADLCCYASAVKADGLLPSPRKLGGGRGHACS